MFRPELRCLIQRDNGEVRPIVSQEKIQAIIDVLVVILSLTIIPIFTYDITVATGKMFWGLLTPGQQWLEISMIIGGIGILLLIKLITDELTTNLVKKFEYLKEQNAENAKRIMELQEENAGLKKKIAKMEKKSEMLDNINELLYSEDDANMQNV